MWFKSNIDNPTLQVVVTATIKVGTIAAGKSIDFRCRWFSQLASS
jgi:hypothetical protein